MGRGRKQKRQNAFALKKRQKRDNPRPDRRSEPYEEIKRENDAFTKYYQQQQICATEGEWAHFMKAICINLPTTFRINGFRNEAKALSDIVETKLFSEYIDTVAELYGISKEEVVLPLRLPWYPGRMAYQLNLTRKDIRRSEPLFRLHNFLMVETNAGSISRQEAVSMIPPLVLDVQPTDKVLDMCAAPGSKTAQLIEALHAAPELHKIPPGFVVANDVDNNRCYMLVHQAKRLNSPCFVVTNHDSSFFPNLLTSTHATGSKSILKFDKVLCDVPCSGDGTLRKNPDIWTKWNLGQAYNLHGVQYRIARRGVELLEIGGRLVYSTCSLNPIENEAVIQRLISDFEDSLEIEDASHFVQGLIYKPGMTNWKLASKDVTELYTSFEEVPEKYHTIIRPSMFPLPQEKIEKIGLEKCMRILPHMQDTGGFFVAVIRKKKTLPFEINEKDENLLKEKNKVDDKEKPSDEDSLSNGAKRKRKHVRGYKEDPYIFFNEQDTDWNELKEFYELDEKLNKRCLLTRCFAEKKKNIYYTSEPIRDIVISNEERIKIINTGVKAFVRCENRHTAHPFRLAQEGLQTINSFVGSKRRITIDREDLILLLNCTDPTKPPSVTELKEATQQQCSDLVVGSCILKYVDTSFTLYVVGWRGTSSLRAYVDNNDTVHILRLLGADLSKFEINKFEKAKEPDVETTESTASKENDEVVIAV